MEDSKKYFISLDNVDIEYLPRLKKYLQGNDCDKVPLWSVVNASKSFAGEICEFELFSKDDKDTTTSECDENNSTEQCHICDTQVPTAYMQAHCTGEKHRICAAIIRHALRRAAQHSECTPFAPTGATAQPASFTHSEGTYFCDHCALAVNVKNKGTHEKTKEHRVSVIHDRLLNGLLITYTDKGRVVADSRYEAEVCNQSDDVSVEEDVSCDDEDVTTALPDDLEDINHNNDVTTLPAILETTFAADTSHAKNSDKDKESSDEEESDAESIVFIDNNVVDLSDDNWAKLSSNSITDQADINQGDAKTFNAHEDIEIVTNGIVRVPAKNYHGISYKLTGGISCLICQKTIDDIEAHIQEPGHIKLLSVPVADRNCIRQISPLWHHCIICNKLVQMQSLHKSSSPHQSKLLSAIVKSKKQQRIPRRLNKMNYCDVCQCEVGKNNNMENHLNGVRHARNLSRTTFTADNRVLHYHFKKEKDEIECIICNIVVRDDETDAHIVSDGHENNYKRFLVTNHISKLNHKAFYCDCCKLKFRQKVTTEIEHVQNISHKIHKSKVSGQTPKVSIPVNVNSIECAERLDVATIQLLYLLETSNVSKRVTCKVCKHTFKNKATQIKNHMNQSYHQYNIEALLYVNKIKNKFDGTYFCEVCRSAIGHTKEFDHINSNDHKINLRNVLYLESGVKGNESSKAAETPAEKDSYDQEINMKHALDDMTGHDLSGIAVSLAENPTSNVDIFNYHNVDSSKRKLHIKHSHLQKIKDVIVCLICNIEVRANDMDAHIESEEHNNNYMRFFVTNHLTKSKSGYNCQACNVKTNINEIVHVNKKKHKLKIPVCKPKTSAPVKVISIQDIEFLDRKVLYLLESSDEPGEIRCKVCKVTMKSNSTQIKEHMTEQYHKFNMDALLFVNKIKNKHDGIYFCEVCHRTIDHPKEIDHINSNDHKINVRNIPLSWRQRGDGAPVNPPEPYRHNREINVNNALVFREKGNDMARVAVPPAENTASNVGNDHHTVYKSENELHSHLNKIKDEIVCFICNAEVHADDIDAHNESNHNINVRNLVSSWRQIGDMTGAAVTPSEKPSSSGTVDSLDHEISTRNALLVCKENANDISKVHMSPDENPTSNVCVSERITLEDFKRLLDYRLDKFCDGILRRIRNSDVRADEIDSDNDNDHNIHVSDRDDYIYMAGAAVTPPENPTSSVNANDSSDHEINMNNAPLACKEKGDDIWRVALTTEENTTSNVENSPNTVDNSKCEILHHLEEIKDELVSLKSNVRNRGDDNDMTGAPVTPPENPTSSVNTKNSYDSDMNVEDAAVACGEKGNDMARVAVPTKTYLTYFLENTTSNVENYHNTVDNSESEILSHVEEINDEIVCIKHDADDRADGNVSYDESVHNIIVTNIPLSWTQKSDVMAGAAVTLAVNSSSIVPIKDEETSHASNGTGSSKTTETSEVQQYSNHDMKRYLSAVPSNPRQVMCQICSAVISSIDSNIKEHFNGRRHKLNYEKFLDDKKKKEQHVACRENYGDSSRVAVSLAENPISNVHILDRNTVDNSERELHYHLKKVKDEIVCSICNAELRDVDIDGHIESDEHNNNYKTFLVEYQITKHKNRFFCYICCCYLKKNMCETEHIKSKTHVDRISVHKAAPSIPVDVNSIQDIEFLDHATSKLLHLIESTDEPIKIRCKVCKLIMKCNSVEIKKHMTDKSHQFNIDALRYVNKIKNKPDGTCFCEVCRITIDHTKEINHINSKYHKMNVRSSKKKGNDIANAAVTPTEHYASNANVKETLNHIPAENHTQEIFVQSEFSLQAIKDIEDFDKIIPIDSEKYFCECCSVHLVKGTVAEHVQKYNHAINVANYIQKQKTSTSKLKDKNIEKCASGSMKNVETPNVKLISYKVYDNFKDGEMSYAYSRTTGSSEVKKESKHDFNSCLSAVPSKPYEVMCQICNTVIPNTDSNKKDHLSGKRHISNYEQFLVDKTQLKTVKTCDINDKVPVVNSTKNDTHKTEAFEAQVIKSIENLRSTEVKTISKHDMNNYLSAVPSKPYEVMCHICNTVITNNDANIKEHLNGRGHKTNYLKEIKDEIVCCERDTDVRADSIDSHDESGYNITARNITSSWTQKGDDMAEAAVSPAENASSNVNINDGATHASNRTENCETAKSSEVQINSNHDMKRYLSAVPSNPRQVMCQICKIVINNVDCNIKEHLNGRGHKTNYEKFLVDNKQLKTVKNCDINVKVPVVKTTKNDTLKTEGIMKAQAIKSIENFRSTEVKTNSKHDMNSYLSAVPSKPYEVLCQICNTVITKNDAHLNDHFNGKIHKLNYEKFVVEQKNQMKTVKEKLPCAINDNVPTAAKTTKNYTHKTEEFVKAQAIKSIENIRSTEVKTDSKHDMKSYLSVVPSKPHEVMCHICNTVITKNDANVKEHLNGTRHKTNYEKFLVDKKKQLKTVTEKVPGDIKVKVPVVKSTKNDTHKTEALVKAQSIFFKHAEGVLYCRCCNTEVKNTQQDVNLHLSGWRHKVKSSAILAENGLRVDKNKIYCDVCEVFLPNLDGITHIDSSKHKTKASAKALDYASANKDVIALPAKTNETNSGNCKIIETTNREQKSVQDNLPKAKEEAKVFCEVCKVYVTNMPVHLNSNQHKLKVNLKVDDDITCKLCNLKVNKNDLKQHENGALHDKNLKEILLKNQISQKWNGVLYCQLCDLFFTPVTLIKHVENENHKKLMYRMVRL